MLHVLLLLVLILPHAAFAAEPGRLFKERQVFQERALKKHQILAARQISAQRQISEARHALVIGIGSYAKGVLKNPLNDASDMADLYKDLGYQVYTDGALINIGLREMRAAIEDFASSLPDGASAVFYFAGHGIASGGDNYLLPVDFKDPFDQDIEFTRQQLPGYLKRNAVGLQTIVNIAQVLNPEGKNIFLLDACRNNPLGETRGGGGSQGLQPIKIDRAAKGVFIGYAAEPGKTAEDNRSSRNGTYTAQLLQAIRQNQGLKIESLHEIVADDVHRITFGAQFPTAEDRLTGNWCFTQCVTTSQSQPPPPRPDAFRVPDTKPGTEPADSQSRKTVVGVLVGAVLLGILAASISDSDDSQTARIGIELRPPVQ